MITDNFCFYLQNRLIQTSQTGGQWYNDTSPFSIPCLRDRFHQPFVCNGIKNKKLYLFFAEVYWGHFVIWTYLEGTIKFYFACAKLKIKNISIKVVEFIRFSQLLPYFWIEILKHSWDRYCPLFAKKFAVIFLSH